MALYELSASEIVEKIRAKSISAVEVATAFIDRIQQVNPRLNAIHQFYPEKILAEAQKKDQELAVGKNIGRLHGLPITLKDAFYAPGFRSAKGNVRLYEESPTHKSAVAVTRLLQQGAIILGITNVPEFLAAYETENPLHGRTYNPYDFSRTPGGSSGGEAALIAAGGSCLGLGSDAAGSTRVPAHYCGIAGFRPTKGLVPTTGNVPVSEGGLRAQISTFGPMARYVADIELMLSVIAGADDGDPFSVPVPLAKSSEVNIEKLRVIYFLDNGIVTPDRDSQKIFAAAIEKIRPLVNSIEVVTPPEILNLSERLMWETCYNVSAPFNNDEFHKRLVEMYKYKKQMLYLMAKADILLTPVTATPARLHGTTLNNIRDFTYVLPFSLAGWPAASINSGFSAEGLPIGLQIAAKPWQDHVVLAFAKKAQQILGIPSVVSVC